jgi:hypothetical protein
MTADCSAGVNEAIAPYIAPNATPTVARKSRTSARSSRRSAIAFADRLPCFHDDRRERSKPSGVRGPVLLPPCSRQRPFGIAG